MIRKSLLTLSALSLGLALAGPADNTLTVGAQQEATNLLDPWRSNNTGIATELNSYMTARLIYSNNDGELIPEIAERVPTLANGDYRLYKDTKGNVLRNRVTYQIRKDAKWSDGTPITSKDFAFWLKVQKDLRVPSPSRQPWQEARIQILNDQSFTITYTPAYLFADKVSPSLAPVHIMGKAYDEFNEATAHLSPKSDSNKISEAWSRFLARFNTSANLMNVVSGPFKPQVWRAGNYFSMERNPNYWRTPPGGANKYLQKIQYRFITNSNTLRINMMSGQLDALSTIGLTFDQAMNLRLGKQSKDKYEVVFVPTGLYEQIVISNQGERAKSLGLNDKRVRQALLYSINRDEITKALFNNYQTPINTWVNPALKFAKKDAKDYPYNPSKASELFSSAGWKIGSDGILQKDGVKMSLKFTTNSGNTLRERIQQVLKEQWRKVGVEIKIDNVPANVMFSTDFSKKNDGIWDLLMFAWGSDPVTEDGSLYASSEIPTKDNGYTGSNYAKYSNPAYDSLWNKARREFDIEKRSAMLKDMQDIAAEDVPVLLMYWRADSYSRDTDLVNFNFTLNSGLISWNAYQMGWGSLGAVDSKGK